jgi:hypothetical protein
MDHDDNNKRMNQVHDKGSGSKIRLKDIELNDHSVKNFTLRSKIKQKRQEKEINALYANPGQLISDEDSASVRKIEEEYEKTKLNTMDF